MSDVTLTSVPDIRERPIALETEMKHIATKADLHRLQVQLVLLQVTVGGTIVAILKLV